MALRIDLADLDEITREHAPHLAPASNVRPFAYGSPESSAALAQPPPEMREASMISAPTTLTAPREEKIDATRSFKPGIVSPNEVGSPGFFRQKIADIEERRKTPWGSPDNHPGFLGKVANGLATAGNLAGELLAPNFTSMIPGSQLNMDVREAEANKDLQKAEQEQRASEESKSKQGLEGAQKTEAEARAESLIHPPQKQGLTPEETTIQDLMTGDNGKPRINPETKQPYTHLEALKAVEAAKQTGKPPTKPDSPEQQYIDEYQKKHPGASVAEAEKHYVADTQKPQQGTYMPLYNDKGQVVGAWDPATGTIRNAPPSMPGTTSQGHGISGKNDKQIEKYQGVLDHVTMADEAAKEPTGPGDYTILMSFVDATKPSSGFRFTEAERKMIIGARSLGQAATAKYDEYTKGPFLGPEQRTQMLDIIHNAARQAQEHITRLQGGEGGGEGGAVKFSDGGKNYNIPSDQVKDFMKDHPNAQRR